MKNKKKLLATVLLPLGLGQTISPWFSSLGGENIITEILKVEKIPENRRGISREFEPELIIKSSRTL
ncbi:hypothetical protein GW756_04935 [bacterium]|nr:hypothetical protein [bacterium]NCQ55723.1 hypothetical protein [Candidatus Parcubacteria bacterium]NCS67672.1 hypothetical protein [Candidatus Peregrinibacteria bacterium]NCS96686.1 hypothetical protein [bacterium]